MSRGNGKIYNVPVRKLADLSWNTASTFRPRRSLLFVPADDAKKVNKASKLAADCITLECEDGVAITQKVSIGSLWDIVAPDKNWRMQEHLSSHSGSC